MIAAAITALIVFAGVIAGFAALAAVAITATRDAGAAKAERAVAAGQADNAEAALATSERLRKREAARAAALEEEMHALEAHPVVPGPARDARDRVLQAWKRSHDDDPDGDTGAGPVGGGAVAVPDAAPGRPGPVAAGGAHGPAGVQR